MNQLFLFWRPTDLFFCAFWPVNQKINLVSPEIYNTDSSSPFQMSIFLYFFGLKVKPYQN